MANGLADSIKVLSIDGGGIRGIIPAVILAEFEKRLGKQLWESFDLIAGTSTGGILAVGLGTACNNGKAYSAEQLVDLYVQNGAAIFKKGGLPWISELLGPKYSSDGLQSVLQKYFGSTQLESACTPLLVSSYDLESQLPFFFKSHKIASDASYNWPVSDVARATSAAPTYFPPFQLAPAKGGKPVYALVDGGVFVNNPSVAAYVEARKLYPDAKKVVVVSVGTGDRQDRIKYTQARSWGLLGWARQIVPVLMDSVSEAADYELEHLPECTYHRLQVKHLSVDEGQMDNVTPENVAALVRIARAYLVSHSAVLDKAYGDLKDGRGSDMPGIGRK